MTSNEIAERLEAFIRRQFAVAPSDTRFNRSALLFENGYVDSVGAVELLAFVQGEFGVVVPDEELLSDEFSTIDGIAAVIGRMTGEPVGDRHPALTLSGKRITPVAVEVSDLPPAHPSNGGRPLLREGVGQQRRGVTPGDEPDSLQVARELGS